MIALAASLTRLSLCVSQMEPVHLKFPSARDGETDQALCWQTEVPVAQGAEIRYQYLVLDSHGQAVHRECQRRSVRIPQNASPGDIGACAPHGCTR